MTNCKLFLLLGLLITSFAPAANKDGTYGARCANALFEQSMSTGRALTRRTFLAGLGVALTYGGYRGLRYLQYRPDIRVVHTAKEAMRLQPTDTENRLIFATNAPEVAESDNDHLLFSQANGLERVRAFQDKKYVGAAPVGAGVTGTLALVGSLFAEQSQKKIGADGVFLTIGGTAKSRRQDYAMLTSAVTQIEQPGYFEKHFPRHPGVGKVAPFLKPARSLLLRGDLNLTSSLQLERVEGSDEFELVGSLEDLLKDVTTLADNLTEIKTIDDDSFYLIMAAVSREWAEELRRQGIKGPLTDSAASISDFFLRPITLLSARDLLSKQVEATHANMKLRLAAAIVEASKAKQDIVVLAFDYERAVFAKLLEEVLAQ